MAKNIPQLTSAQASHLTDATLLVINIGGVDYKATLKQIEDARGVTLIRQENEDFKTRALLLKV